jgi:enoyl-CoA hydratase
MPSIHLRQDGAIARVLIDHPERRNAVNRAMWRSIPERLAQASQLEGVRVLTLESAVPGCFAAGADISEFAETYATRAGTMEANEEIQRAIAAMAACEVPTVALVDGPCVGGAVALLLACDIRWVSTRAKFALTPARLGLSYHPSDVVRLVRTCGRSGAAELLFSGQAWDAARAAAGGLVDRVLPEAEFAAAADALLAGIAKNSLDATRTLKRSLDAAFSGSTGQLAQARAEFEALFSGADFIEGRDAFLAKRAAVFPSHARSQRA